MKKKQLIITLMIVGFIFLTKSIINTHIFTEIWTRGFTNDIRSLLIEDDSDWHAEVIQAENEVSLDNTFFVSNNIGYGYSKEYAIGNLYKTLDAGRTWKKLGSSIAHNIKGISFVDNFSGFVITSEALPSTVNKDLSRLLKTDDGGESWKTIYSSEFTIFRKIIFNHNKVGVVAGKRLLADGRNSSTFVLITTDGGNSWNDLSHKLNQLIIDKQGNIDESLTDVFFSDEKGIVVLSNRGAIYSSLDYGESWNRISKLQHEPLQTKIIKSGELNDGKLWIAGGTRSMEGVWGMFSFVNWYSGWDRYRLNDYNFADIEPISANEILACGDYVSADNYDETKGVILYSYDKGQNWSILHKSQTSTVYTSISKLSEGKFFISGDNGESILLEKP